jgi:hypothetical protein
MSALFNDAIVTAFANIGVRNGSAINKFYSADQLTNKDPLVLELYVAHKAKQLAEARYKAALAACERDGLIVREGQVGTTTALYTSPIVTLSRQIKTPASRLDATKFRTELTLAGVKDDIINRAEERATVFNAPATSFVVALNGG